MVLTSLVDPDVFIGQLPAGLAAARVETRTADLKTP